MSQNALLGSHRTDTCPRMCDKEVTGTCLRMRDIEGGQCGRSRNLGNKFLSYIPTYRHKRSATPKSSFSF